MAIPASDVSNQLRPGGPEHIRCCGDIVDFEGDCRWCIQAFAAPVIAEDFELLARRNAEDGLPVAFGFYGETHGFGEKGQRAIIIVGADPDPTESLDLEDPTV